MADEPTGHRGHPTEAEVKRAGLVSIRLARIIRRLQQEGFDHFEAVNFVSATAFMEARVEGECWSTENNARLTVMGLLSGRAAKEWSLQAIIHAMIQIAEMLYDVNTSWYPEDSMPPF